MQTLTALDRISVRNFIPFIKTYLRFEICFPGYILIHFLGQIDGFVSNFETDLVRDQGIDQNGTEIELYPSYLRRVFKLMLARWRSESESASQSQGDFKVSV